MTVHFEQGERIGGAIGCGRVPGIGGFLVKTDWIRVFSAGILLPVWCCCLCGCGGLWGAAELPAALGGRFRAADPDPISRLQLPGDFEKWI